MRLEIMSLVPRIVGMHRVYAQWLTSLTMMPRARAIRRPQFARGCPAKVTMINSQLHFTQELLCFPLELAICRGDSGGLYWGVFRLCGVSAVVLDPALGRVCMQEYMRQASVSGCSGCSVKYAVCPCGVKNME